MPFGKVEEIDDLELEEEKPIEVPIVYQQPRRQERKKKESRLEDIDMNDFLQWVLSLDETKYPACSAIIKRAKKYGRVSFLKDAIELVKKYMEEKNSAT